MRHIEGLMLAFVKQTIFKTQVDTNQCTTMQFLESVGAECVLGLALMGLWETRNLNYKWGYKTGRGGKGRSRRGHSCCRGTTIGSSKTCAGGRRGADTPGEDGTLGSEESKVRERKWAANNNLELRWALEQEIALLADVSPRLGGC